MSYEKLSPTLRAQKRWVHAINTPITYGGKELPEKTPVHPTEFYPVSITEESNFYTFEEVLKNIEAAEIPLYPGYVFYHTEHSESSIVGIDIDIDVDILTRDQREELKTAINTLVKDSGTYAEASQSGNGIHIFAEVAGTPDIGFKKSVLFPGTTIPVKVEVYSSKRYFLCTGKALTKSDVAPMNSVLRSFLTSVSHTEDDPQREEEKIILEPQSPKMDDDQVLSLIGSSKQSLDFVSLHSNGDLSSCDNDHSKAVARWMGILLFYTQDMEQIDRLFRQSALYSGQYRDVEHGGKGKWKRRYRIECEDLLSKMKAFFGTAHPRNPIINTIINEFGKIRRDLFTDGLYVEHEGRWKNIQADAHIPGHIKALCRPNPECKVTHIEESIARYAHYLKPRLLIDIPDWDGIDRIGQLGLCLEFSEPTVNAAMFTDILKDWCARMWERIFNPSIQNRCIILSGPQGIGKDVWIEALTGGLRQYVGNFTSYGKYGKQRDYAEQMRNNAVLVISEFDKVQEMGSSMLKELITCKSFEYRAAYARESTTNENRTSFIAACNPEHVLTDFTGNRRFAVFRITRILWEYPRSFEDQNQILAQCRVLALQGYKAAAENVRILEQLTARYTPEDPNVALVADFDEYIYNRLQEANKDYWLFSSQDRELDRLFRRLMHDYGFSRIDDVRNLLSQSGRKYLFQGRIKNTKIKRRYYGLEDHCQDEDTAREFCKSQIGVIDSELNALDVSLETKH